MKTQYQYFKGKLKNSTTLIETASLDELQKFAQANGVQNIFVLNTEETSELKEKFAVAYNGVLLLHATMGFESIEHYTTSIEKEFPSAELFYEALQAGYTKYSDYLLVQEAGINDLATFETMKKKGFINAYEKFKEMSTQFSENAEIKNLEIDNPYKLFKHAQKHGFDDAESLLIAFVNGFTDANIYAAAKEYGFSNFADFTEATAKGFSCFSDLDFARQHNIDTVDDLKVYFMLSMLKTDNETQDQLVLITILSKLEQGKKISINKLQNLLASEIKNYCNKQTEQLPAWFVQSLHSVDEVVNFLQKNNGVKRYGNYDADGEYFEIHKIQDRSIVIDASNVAHNSNNTSNKKVSAQRIITMIEFLKAKGFIDITTIADASLRHKVADPEQYDKLKKEYQYIEAPRETSADNFILDLVKAKHCLVVSNDTFRQWKMQDSWVAENIDYYRLSFIINNNEVLMPDVK